MSFPIESLPELLTEQQATEYLQLADGTLSVWRSTRRHGLPFVKVGRCVRYRRADLAAWLAARTVSPVAADDAL
jgi:excisionase family DNA binding protein